MSRYRVELKNYFLNVTRELLERGAIRSKRGDSLLDVLQTESREVYLEVEADFFAVIREIGIPMAAGMADAGKRLAADFVQNKVEQGIDAAGRALWNMVTGSVKKR